MVNNAGDGKARPLNEIRDFWDRVAEDWRTQVGTEGDRNRILNSDPILWKLAGDVTGLRVLDAGCGTGYLTRQLHDRGAQVTGVDLSPKMIEIARADHPGIAFAVDSVSELLTQPSAHFGLVVANYVLMDAPDLAGALAAFHHVLRPGGHAILIFSHPCFPAGISDAKLDPADPDRAEILYHWTFHYFEPSRRIDPPWGHFTSEFIWFHRPLSVYWKAFCDAGFRVTDLEEPRLTESRYDLARDAKELASSRHRPYSIAFRLEKPQSTSTSTPA